MQLCRSQDVVLRTRLINNEFNVLWNGGNVSVVNLNSLDLITKFQNKEIDGAWILEPLL